MTGATLTDAPTLFGPVGEGGTLDDLLVALWEGITSDHVVACPLCDGEMKPAYGAHARAIGGKCAKCGSTLS